MTCTPKTWPLDRGTKWCSWIGVWISKIRNGVQIERSKIYFFLPFLTHHDSVFFISFQYKTMIVCSKSNKDIQATNVEVMHPKSAQLLFWKYLSAKTRYEEKCAFYITDVPILIPGLQWKSNQYSSALKCFRPGMTNFMLDVLHRKSTYSLWKQKKKSLFKFSDCPQTIKTQSVLMLLLLPLKCRSIHYTTALRLTPVSDMKRLDGHHLPLEGIGVCRHFSTFAVHVSKMSLV